MLPYMTILPQKNNQEREKKKKLTNYKHTKKEL